MTVKHSKIKRTQSDEILNNTRRLIGLASREIQLGDEVIDKVTGFRGIAIARTMWLYGCARVTVQPKVDKDGKNRDPEGFDEMQLEVVKKKVTKSATKKQRRTGGPRPLISKAKSIF